MILVNATHHTQSTTRFKLTGETITCLYEIERDGVIREKSFTYDEEGFVKIEECFQGITTKTFLLETE